MTDRIDNLEMTAESPEHVLLQRLLHLKKYETPDASRMTRHKHNIMRQVRDVSHQKRWSLEGLLEVNVPWFFAEPRYGIALLFVVFAGLQFWGISSQKQARNKTGIYTSGSSMVALDPSTVVSTNRISYPKLPDNLQLFPDQRGDSGVKFVGRIEEKK
jgi:hypothetical protein